MVLVMIIVGLNAPLASLPRITEVAVPHPKSVADQDNAHLIVVELRHVEHQVAAHPFVPPHAVDLV